MLGSDMAKKQRTSEQEAISRAMAQPERWWNVNRHCAWVVASGWSFFTNYRGFSFCAGHPAKKFHGPDVPEYLFTMQLDWWKPKLMAWWHNRRLV